MRKHRVKSDYVYIIQDDNELSQGTHIPIIEDIKEILYACFINHRIRDADLNSHLATYRFCQSFTSINRGFSNNNRKGLFHVN